MATAKKTTAKKKPAKRAYTRKPKVQSSMKGPDDGYPEMDHGGGTAYVGGFSAVRPDQLAGNETVNVNTQKHAHHFRNISHLDKIDVYRITDLFDIADHALGHALKKIIVAAGRGAGKTSDQDVQEAIDSLVRWQEMQAENALKVG